MSESSMSKTMRKRFLAHFSARGAHWVRIEDLVGLGTPDINWSLHNGGGGWIETKQVNEEDIPKRVTTPLKVGLRPEQRLWAIERQKASSDPLAIQCVVKVGREWFVFRSHWDELFNGVPLSRLREIAVHNWSGAFLPELLVA